MSMQRLKMEGPDERNGASADDVSQLSRNRSFKTKQLVRSQAIRESQSPPRTISPAVHNIDVEYDDETYVDDNKSDEANKAANEAAFDVNKDDSDGDKENINKEDLESKVEVAIVRTHRDNVTSDVSSHGSDDRCSVNSLSERNECAGDDKKKQPVEIQITPGWEETQNTQRQRTKRWLGTKQHSSRDLLSNNPRVTCVCGACSPCPQCRGRRRRQLCPTKQDSGIVCSDDCADCSDTEQSGGSHSDGARKIADRSSLDVDDQTPYYCRCPERKEKPKSLSLSRTDSEEKSEPTGVDLVDFIKQTLNKNARDRVTLLKIEKELHSLISDAGRCIVRFPVMTSYGRMLVHRCAALFQLSHHLDHANKTCVLVSKSGTSGGRIPCTSFRQWCTAAFPPSPQRHNSDQTHAKSILKRANQSGEELEAGAGSSSRSKSLEQREKEYERVRRRIFSEENPDECQWPWLSGGPVKLLTPDTGRNKLLKVQSLESSTGASSGGGSCRGVVSKSHSFGGYGTQPQPRVLSRHGDMVSSSWRLSPSSSGYRTLSLHSADSVTPSPTGAVSPEPTGDVVWCVTDLSAVPSGAMLIHPQSGRPLTNPDGSVYHYDPSRPPPMPPYQAQQKVDQSGEKRRGRLEKQHSFIDNECESAEEQGKCCCECRHHDRVDNKVPTQTEEKICHKPASPFKNRNERIADAATNHSAIAEPPTNHRPPFEPPPTNQQPEPVSQSYEHYSPNPRAAPYEPTSQRELNLQRQQSFEKPYECRPQEGHRPQRLLSHESHEFAGQFPQYRHEDQMTSPQALPPDPSLQLHKMMPAPLPDPNLRPISLSNVMYPAPVPQPYPYLNQYRIDQPLQAAMYQPLVPPPLEEKQVAPSAHNENTFRIDPSYPYAPLEYAAPAPAACGACDPQRGVSMQYAPVEAAPPLAPPYPLHGVLLPQHMQPYPYQEPLQWAGLQPMGHGAHLAHMAQGAHVTHVAHAAQSPAPKLLVHPLYQYHYPLVYPQMIPQPYPVCAPVGPPAGMERRPSLVHAHRQSKRNSLSGSSRNTPLQTPNEDKKVPYDDMSQTRDNNAPVRDNPAIRDNPVIRDNPPVRDNPAVRDNQTVPRTESQFQRQNSNEIAVKIQQIKDQMAQLNTRERDSKGQRGREEWKRNSGNGILGNYPANNYNGKVVGRPPPNDETQLSSAARAIVNSIRNMQAKNTYHQDRRPDYNHHQNQYREKTESQTQQHHNHNQSSYNQNNSNYNQNQSSFNQNQSGFNQNQSSFNQNQSSYNQNQSSYNQNQSNYNQNQSNQNQRVRRERREGERPQAPCRVPHVVQMSPGVWCRRSPAPVHPVLNPPRRPHPDSRNPRR